MIGSGFFLSLDDDLRPFYAIGEADPAFAPVMQELYGYHQVKFLSPFEISESVRLKDGETYEAHLSRDPSVAGTMAFQAEGGLERQIGRYVDAYRLGGWDVVAVLLNSTKSFGVYMHTNDGSRLNWDRLTALPR